jgi:uncharacterized SAM-binding protein YcdF (DUF218 family)
MAMADRPFDVIIVLGAAQKPDGEAGPAMARRVFHGVQCFRNAKGANLLMSGGRTTTDIPESRTMADLACRQGVEEGAVFQEDCSTRTLENAVECRKVMADKGWVKSLLVTDSFHMPRAVFTFRAFAIDVTPEPVVVPVSLMSTLSFLREGIARAVYPGTIRRYLAENS